MVHNKNSTKFSSEKYRTRNAFHMVLISLSSMVVKQKPNLVPRLFLRGRKDPGRSWSRDVKKFDCLRGVG